MASQQENQEVESVIREWNAGFNNKDIPRIKAQWDQNYPQLIYIAEENNDALLDWASINNYYDGLTDAVDSLKFNIDNLTVDVFGDGACAYLTFLAKAQIKGMDHEMTFNGRNTFVLRKTAGQWKIIHYHESLSRDHSHETWGFMFK